MSDRNAQDYDLSAPLEHTRAHIAPTPAPSSARPGPIARPGGKSASIFNGGPRYTHLPVLVFGDRYLFFPEKFPGESWFG